MSAEVRWQPMSRGQAERAYKSALAYFGPRHSLRMYGIQEFVRCLRAEAKGWRHQARNAERQVELLKIELEAARRGNHE